MCFEDFNKDISRKSKMNHVVKCDVCLNILLMGSIYVITSILLRGKPNSGQNKSLRAPPRCETGMEEHADQTGSPIFMRLLHFPIHGNPVGCGPHLLSKGYTQYLDDGQWDPRSWVQDPASNTLDPIVLDP